MALTELSHYTVASGQGQGIDPIYNSIFWPCSLKEAQEDQTVKCIKSNLYSNLIFNQIRVNGLLWAIALSYLKHLSSFSKVLNLNLFVFAILLLSFFPELLDIGLLRLNTTG